jgi:hypothetical protein
MPQIKGGKKVLLRIWIRVTLRKRIRIRIRVKSCHKHHKLGAVEVHKGAMEAYNGAVELPVLQIRNNFMGIRIRFKKLSVSAFTIRMFINAGI